jgi:hypothetical protein
MKIFCILFALLLAATVPAQFTVAFKGLPLVKIPELKKNMILLNICSSVYIV